MSNQETVMWYGEQKIPSEQVVALDVLIRAKIDLPSEDATELECVIKYRATVWKT
jgi:hypothetical protein